MQRVRRCVPAAAIAVLIAGLAQGPANAKSGGGHGGPQAGSGSRPAAASAPRDAASGLPSGKRMHKPYTASAKPSGGKPSGGKRTTPDKVEAGSENVR